MKIIGRDGRSIVLSQIVDRHDCPLSKGVKDNLRAMKVLRDDVEHRATNAEFTQHNHTQAWRKFEARPRNRAAQPENTNRDFCIFHAAHGDYTFSDQWVQKLIEVCGDAQQLQKLKSFKL